MFRGAHQYVHCSFENRILRLTKGVYMKEYLLSKGKLAKLEKCYRSLRDKRWRYVFLAFSALSSLLILTLHHCLPHIVQ